MSAKEPEPGASEKGGTTRPDAPGSHVSRRSAGTTSVRARLGFEGTVRLRPAAPASSEAPDATLGATAEGDDAVGVAFDQTLHQDPLSSPDLATSTPPPPGAWTDKLTVGEELGRGGMAVVLRATDRDLRRELAVKVSHAGAGGSEGEKVRFVEEAQITAQLEHPNVVPVHELGIDPDGRPFFTMKMVRGQSLEAILQKRREADPDTLARFGLRRLLDVFTSVCQAMEYAHARGVIHRDLKPANIMVGDFGEVLVMDWGVAKVLGQASVPSGRRDMPSDVETVRSQQGAHQTVSGTVLGTPSYMAPEQARGDTDVDERADIYALGAILYELLCGRPPFEGPDALRVLTRVMSEPPVPPSKVAGARKVPVVLEELALRLLEKSPAKRWVTIPQIRSQVQDYIEGIAVAYRPETFAGQLAWAAGGLGVFVFVVWYLTGQSAAQMLSPRVALHTAGWFMLILVLAYPLWSFVRTSRVMRRKRDRFRTPSEPEVFVSGFLAHRRFTAAVAPLFQLAFLAEMSVWIAPGVLRERAGKLGLVAEASSAGLLQDVVQRLHAEASNALIIPFVMLFAYIYLQSTEVRFARSIDRFEPLLRRSAWELVWPFALVVTILGLVFGMDFVRWGLARGVFEPLRYLDQQVLSAPIDVFQVVKTIVFQGTFLGGLLALTLLLIYPFPEILAALRLRYQAVDQAYVRARRPYFLRSLSVFHVARANALYGGTAIGCLTAMTVLAGRDDAPLLADALAILGPSLIGFATFAVISSYLRGCLSQSPAVKSMLEARIQASRIEEVRARYRTATAATWASRLVQLLGPVIAVGLYLVWVGGEHPEVALADVVVPSSFKDLIAALPFALLIPAVLVGDRLQKRLLRWRHGSVVEGDVYVTMQLDREGIETQGGRK